MKAGADHEFGRTDTDTGTIYWDKLQELMDMDTASNRLNRGNAFGAWEYVPPEYEYEEYDRNGKGKGKRTLVKQGGQEFVARSPGMKSAQDRMDRRLGGEGFEDYERPSQVSAITDALMADKMEKMGLINPGVASLKQDQYGPRFGDINNRPMPPSANPQPPSANPQPPSANPQPPGRPTPPGVIPGTPPADRNTGLPPQMPHATGGQQAMSQDEIARLLSGGR